VDAFGLGDVRQLLARKLHGDERIQIEIGLDCDRVRILFARGLGRVRRGRQAKGERCAKERGTSQIPVHFCLPPWIGRPLREARLQPQVELYTIKPNKTKQNSSDLLGFICPNRDFSMGYEPKNKKIRARVSGCAQNVSDASLPSLLQPHRMARTSL
jgi:hypothetical protein